jgi:hypothetical protein
VHTSGAKGCLLRHLGTMPVMQVSLVLLVLGAVVAGEADPPARLVVEYEDRVVGQAAQGADRAEVDAMWQQLEDRLRRARAELPQVPATVARVIREDIGVFEAERERVAALRGGAVVIGTRRFVWEGAHLAMVADDQRVVVDLAAGTALLAMGDQERPVTMQRVGEVRPVAEGVAAEAIAGRAVLRFSMTIDDRQVQAFVALALPNPFRHVVPAEGDPLVAELARLPGLPLRVVFKNDDYQRSIEAVRVD